VGQPVAASVLQVAPRVRPAPPFPTRNTERPGIVRGLKLVRCRLDRASMGAWHPPNSPAAAAAKSDCWHIYFGDVHVGTIARRSGAPVDVDQWGWRCGFYPPSHNGRHIEGTAKTFEQARADFEVAWKEYPPKCSEADFEEYRRERARTAWKYAMRDAHCKLPTQMPSGVARCFCGTSIDIKGTSPHIYAAHMDHA
jgi:hypothetical protein